MLAQIQFSAFALLLFGLVGLPLKHHTGAAYEQKYEQLHDPFYYLAPRTEGFGARFKQLLGVANEIVLKRNRTLVLVPYRNQMHHADTNKLFSLCDVLEMPEKVVCSKESPASIITSNECVVVCTTDWMCNPHSFLNYAAIKKVLTFRGKETSKRGQSQKEIEKSSNFTDIGVRVAGTHNFTSERCGFVYSYHDPVPNFRVKFTREYEAKFEKRLSKLKQHVPGVAWSSIHAVHYRRGDKIKSLCSKPKNREKYKNCKAMKDFIAEVRTYTNDSLYIATDEEAEDQLDVLRSSNNTFSKLTLLPAGIKLNSIELLIFELQLLLSAKVLYIIDGASTLTDFLVLARGQQTIKGRSFVSKI